jgi:hypothetical protein
VTRVRGLELAHTLGPTRTLGAEQALLRCCVATGSSCWEPAISRSASSRAGDSVGHDGRRAGVATALDSDDFHRLGCAPVPEATMNTAACWGGLPSDRQTLLAPPITGFVTALWTARATARPWASPPGRESAPSPSRWRTERLRDPGARLPPEPRRGHDPLHTGNLPVAHRRASVTVKRASAWDEETSGRSVRHQHLHLRPENSPVDQLAASSTRLEVTTPSRADPADGRWPPPWAGPGGERTHPPPAPRSCRSG